MILSGKKIHEYIMKPSCGRRILIEPFEESQLNPNSYNVRLDPKLAYVLNSEYTYELDAAKECELDEFTIPEQGVVLQPNRLYLGRTYEYTETEGLVPMLEGRSSIGRLGMFIHVTAGFGDVGFHGYWTLEISVIQPLRIYPFMEVGQLFYHTIEGDYDSYNSKYHKNTGLQKSKIHTERHRWKYNVN
jgi:dCTP deaminase